MTIELHIEELVLHGTDLPPGGRDRLQESLLRELTQLLQSHGENTFEQGYAVPNVVAPTLLSSPQSDLPSLGRQLAVAVHGSLLQPQGGGPR